MNLPARRRPDVQLDAARGATFGLLLIPCMITLQVGAMFGPLGFAVFCAVGWHWIALAERATRER